MQGREWDHWQKAPSSALPPPWLQSSTLNLHPRALGADENPLPTMCQRAAWHLSPDSFRDIRQKQGRLVGMSPDPGVRPPEFKSQLGHNVVDIQQILSPLCAQLILSKNSHDTIRVPTWWTIARMKGMNTELSRILSSHQSTPDMGAGAQQGPGVGLEM